MKREKQELPINWGGGCRGADRGPREEVRVKRKKQELPINWGKYRRVNKWEDVIHGARAKVAHIKGWDRNGAPLYITLAGNVEIEQRGRDRYVGLNVPGMGFLGIDSLICLAIYHQDLPGYKEEKRR